MKHNSQKFTRTAALALTVSLTGAALAGCGATNGNNNDVEEPDLLTEVSASETTADTPDDNDENDENDGNDEGTDGTRAAATGSGGSDGNAPRDGFSAEPTEQFGGGLSDLRTTDIRVGSHDGFERLVFEYEGQGLPEFHAGYTDDPRQQASGYPLEVPGNAALELMIHGTPRDMTTDAKYGKKENLGLSQDIIVDVVSGGAFEADSQYVVGLDKKRPYKISVLENPTRLVVDIQK